MSVPIEHLINQFASEVCEPPEHNPDDLPYPVRKGVLDLGGIKMRCYVLNTGQRIIDSDDLEKFFGGLTDV